jgi:hypothetical protein
MNDVYDLIALEDLTSDLAMVAESCGLDLVRKLLRNFGGISFYIPKLSRLESFVMRYLDSNKVKPNKEIAIELGVSETFLRDIRKKMKNSKKYESNR